MGVWSHIFMEAFCMYRHLSQKKHTFVELDKTLDKVKSETVKKNENYIPKRERPIWCKNNNKKLVPQFRCLCNGKYAKKCPFIAFTDVDKKERDLFEKVYWEEVVKKEGEE